MLFQWWRERRRRRWMARPFPDRWSGWLEVRVPHHSALNRDERRRLRELVSVFIEEKRWEGIDGVVVTDEIRVTIAGQACLLLLGLEHDYFRNVDSILIFPRGFLSLPKQRVDAAGVVHESMTPSLGEAWRDGPVLLSWADSLAGGVNPSDGLNVVIHEFAHKLDLRDGVVNGVPPLKNRREYARWSEIMRREYDALIDRSEAGRATLLDAYGATHPGEFFAVAVECFFEKPGPMRSRHRELYEVLRDYFGQDPAARLER